MAAAAVVLPLKERSVLVALVGHPDGAVVVAVVVAQ